MCETPGASPTVHSTVCSLDYCLSPTFSKLLCVHMSVCICVFVRFCLPHLPDLPACCTLPSFSVPFSVQCNSCWCGPVGARRSVFRSPICFPLRVNAFFSGCHRPYVCMLCLTSRRFDHLSLLTSSVTASCLSWRLVTVRDQIDRGPAGALCMPEARPVNMCEEANAECYRSRGCNQESNIRSVSRLPICNASLESYKRTQEATSLAPPPARLSTGACRCCRIRCCRLWLLESSGQAAGKCRWKLL